MTSWAQLQSVRGRGSHTASHRHTVSLWWGSLVPGVFGGAVTFLGMRRLTLRARSQSEGVLAFLYVLSFVAVFAATVGVSWAVRLGFSS